MSILLETTFGDLVLDLDIKGSPSLSKNLLKLTKARYFTNTLIYNVVPGKYCQMGDPRGDGTGGCSIYGLIDAYQSAENSSVVRGQSNRSPPDVTKSQRRFLQSQGRQLSSNELNQKGVVIAMEMGNVPHTIGSQFLITLSENNGLSDNIHGADNNPSSENNKDHSVRYISLGSVAEDTQNILSKLNRAYCDDDGRPWADIRIQRALVIYDPFDDDPEGMDDLLRMRGVTIDTTSNAGSDGEDLKEGYPLAPRSPKYDKPPEEVVDTRILADDTTLFATAGWDAREFDDDEEEDEATRQKRLEIQEKQEEEWRKRQDQSRAVMLEMLGDLPDAEIKAPEDVLFVCKLNPLTTDEDLELIFARFDSKAKAEIIRDPDTGSSLQYAFVEFSSKEACNEAYLKMNNALVDDRRIRVDFSQSVAKVWDRYHKKYRQGDRSGGIDRGFTDGRGRGGRGSSGGRGRGGGGGRGRGGVGPRPMNMHHRQQESAPLRYHHDDRQSSEIDSFGRRRPNNERPRPRSSDYNQQRSFSRSPSPSRHGSRSRSRSRSYRRSRSRSSESSYDSRRRKKHKHRHSRKRRQRSRSRSRDRERKKKRHKHRHHSRKSDSRKSDSRKSDKQHRR